MDDEHAEHAGLEHQQADEEGQPAVLDGVPGAEDGHHREERGEQDQQQGDAVDAQVVGDAQAGDPGVVLLELEVGGAGLELVAR